MQREQNELGSENRIQQVREVLDQIELRFKDAFEAPDEQGLNFKERKEELKKKL